MLLTRLTSSSKSQLAIEFAHQVAEKSLDKWVFWVHAGTRPRVEQGFRSIAEAVRLPGRNQPNADLPNLVSNWLSNERNGRWVMILDSADDIDVFYGEAADTADGRPLASYLPQSPHGSILVTTRSRNLASKLVGDHRDIISVGSMTEANALQLVEKRLGRSLSDEEITVATDLVRALDLIPLPISQAAAYIQASAPRSSLEKYLAEFRESESNRARLLGRDAGDLRREGGASNSVRTTWEISFDYIRSKRPSAAELLSLMSFFDPQGIPDSLLKPDEQTKKAIWSSPPLLKRKGWWRVLRRDGGFEDDVQMLRDYCLVSASKEEDVFEMHGLVQLSTRKWLESYGLQEKFKKQHIKRLDAAVPKPINDHKNWPACRKLFAHVVAAIDLRPADGKTQETWAALMGDGGMYALRQCNYDVAERMFRQAKRVYEERFGPEHEDALRSTLYLGVALSNKKLRERADELFLQVMETSKSALGIDHPDTLASIGYYAQSLGHQGRLEESEKVWVKVIEAMKSKLGADHALICWCLEELGWVYGQQHRFEEAEQLQAQAMEAHRIRFGADNPSTLLCMHDLAVTRKALGRDADALALMKTCADSRKRVLGPSSPHTLLSERALDEWGNIESR